MYLINERILFMDSIWSEYTMLPHFHTLKDDIKTDVLIIGGGITGILCAYFLQEKGIDYILAEGQTICSGITKNTTAKITSQHGLIYHKLLKRFGLEKTKLYLQANQTAVKKYFALCQTIDCDFEEKPSYVYSIDNRKKLEKEADALQQIGFPFKFTEVKELPFSTVGAICFEQQAQFHPLKFLAQIAQNLAIYEHTFIKELAPNIAVTDQGNIRYQRLIITTHFPIDNKHGMYFLKMYQHRSYVVALEHAAKLHGIYVDEASKGMSFRNYKDLLLVGGGSHRTGKKGGNWQELREFAEKYYPSSIEKAYWATQDCMTLDQVPYIGLYSKNMPQCYVATGFQKWGISSSMLAAMILSDQLAEKENPFASIFRPSRSIVRLQLLKNSWESILNLLTPTRKRCPHLGCALKWNSAEHSWDCPCHGSRFTENGTLLDNPANGDCNLK